MSKLAELIRLEGRMDAARSAAILAELDTIKRQISGVLPPSAPGRHSGVQGKVDVLPRVLAEMLDERDRGKS